MGKKKRTPFATDQEQTTLYVELRSTGIHPLVVFCDGLSLTFFGREKKAYMKVPDVIDWHRRELKQTRGRCGDADVAEALEKAQAAFEAGKITDA